jgi:hypothetical protein
MSTVREATYEVAAIGARKPSLLEVEVEPADSGIQRSDIYLRIGRARLVCIRRLVSLMSRSRPPWKSSHARRHNSCERGLRSYLKEGTRFETGLAACNGSPSTLP